MMPTLRFGLLVALLMLVLAACGAVPAAVQPTGEAMAAKPTGEAMAARLAPMVKGAKHGSRLLMRRSIRRTPQLAL